MEDGRAFTIFRHVIVTPGTEVTSPQAIFCVRFHLARMAPETNKIFSWLPMPFFVGLPGFRAKFWALDEKSGDWLGLYAWQTVAAAEAYAHSFAMRFMTRRSVPGSVTHEILPSATEAGKRWLAALDVDVND